LSCVERYGYNTIKLGFKKKAKAHAAESKRKGSSLSFDVLRRGFLQEMTLNLTATVMGGIYPSPEELEKAKAEEAECEKKDKKKKDKKDAKDGNKAVKGDANEAQCRKKAGEGRTKDGAFHGGRHGTLTKGETGTGLESHHMPAKSTYSKLNRGSVSEINMPAILMTEEDHSKTASHGHEGNDGKIYRNRQKALIALGQFKAAMNMDIDDIRKNFGSKYDDAIAEMKAWAKCMKYIK
jgi:hypothetical protein